MSVERMIDFPAIERKWQKKWEKEKAFEVKEKKGKKKYYVLEMYPYPSAYGLHMGHALNYTIGDIYARYKRMNGFQVLYPMGFDSFGLPAENAAIKHKSHPKKFTEEAIKNFVKQQKSLGLSYDWSRMIWSHSPEYYKWDQWIFLKMLEKGLAYKKKAPVNYCKKCKTVLANEQVVNGKCWRHEDTDVEVKQLEQWFLKITDYADELYEDLDKLEGWPEMIRAMQKNWIGKSEGVEVDFEIVGKREGWVWPVFTTRADTLFGVTFLVVSAQHPDLMSLVTPEQKAKVENFLKKLRSVSSEDLEKMDKDGVFTGTYAKHPLTGENIPIWVGNFVVADYGSGMVMAVPAHDARDFDFAKKYGLEIKQVIAPLFVTTKGKDAVRVDEPNDVRNSVFGIVKHWKEDKYYCLDWKNFGWKSLVIGGVDEGESFEDAVAREVREETGYQDIKSVKEIGFENHSNYYAEHKKVNRYGKYKTFLVELGSSKYVKPDPIHVKNHEGLWLDKKEVGKFLNLVNNEYVWDIYENGEKAYTSYGVLVNSEGFDGLKSAEAIEHIANALSDKKCGRKKTAFRIRDWLVSRQRFWGCPIPVVYCYKCGIVGVKEKDLPVKLPENIKFENEKNPLEKYDKFLKVKCPKCGGEARRETDTMDTFVDSSWYFLRYCDAHNDKKIFDSKKVNYWCPIDFYIGGKEHTTGHLIYFRFFTKFLRDLGVLGFDEPALRLFNQGILHGEDGRKMSKSYGNVVNPDEMINKYGADMLRMALVSSAGPDKDSNWSGKIMEGSQKFVLRVMDYISSVKIGKSSKRVSHKVNKGIKAVSEDVSDLKYNLGVIALREMFYGMESEEEIGKKDLQSFVKLLSVFCPHISEELWSGKKLNGRGFVSLSEWPKCDVKKIDEKIDEAEKAVENVIDDIKHIKELAKVDKPKVYVYCIPPELKIYGSNIERMKTLAGAKEVQVWAVNDPKKYDPQGKSKKAKPGKPGIYVE